MVISSLVVATLPERTDAVARALQTREGVTVHQIVGHNVVVTVEAETLDASSKIAGGMHDIEGVCTVGLAYANFEEDPTLNYGQVSA